MKLIIVESPAKARTISRFLGPEYSLAASYGHIRDLPGSAREIPAKYKKEPWARLGVNPDEGYAPVYVVSGESKKHVARAQKAGQGTPTRSSWRRMRTEREKPSAGICWRS